MRVDRYALRATANWLNLSTALGLGVARIGGAGVRRGERGVWIATGYRLRFPLVSAFTIGNVIASRHDDAWLADHAALLRHEERHCTQYAFCVGVVMLPLYLAAMGISWLLTGDRASANPFERTANLAEGGYPERAPRWRHRFEAVRDSD